MKVQKYFATILLATTMAISGCAQQSSKSTEVASKNGIVHLDVKTFAEQTKSGVTLVDFWAPWCPPCRMMAPVLEDVAKEVNGKVTVAKVNVDVEQNKQLAAQFQISGIPTLILFKDGKEINRFVGLQTKEFLIQQLSQVK
jgi:thioredoxin